MSGAKRTYHHGDLGRVLIDNATQIIRDGGIEALSMRKLADQCDVSRSAPYHHFKDKNELLCAIAIDGFKQQQATLTSISTGPSKLSPRERFHCYVRAYVRFAEELPETYDLMFGKEIWKLGQPTSELQRISKESFQQWVEWVEKLQREGLLSREEPSLRVAQTCWATLHGLCRLKNDGIYINRTNLEQMAKTAAALLIERE